MQNTQLKLSPRTEQHEPNSSNTLQRKLKARHLTTRCSGACHACDNCCRDVNVLCFSFRRWCGLYMADEFSGSHRIYFLAGDCRKPLSFPKSLCCTRTFIGRSSLSFKMVSVRANLCFRTMSDRPIGTKLSSLYE